jgi:hypothetical protein
MLRGKKHIQEMSAETADPSATLGDDKGEGDIYVESSSGLKVMKILGPTTTFSFTTTVSFVIPSEAEGSAVSTDPSWICFRSERRAYLPAKLAGR